MSEYKIEKGVPIPPLKTGLKDALLSMDVGDSFAYAEERNDTVRAMIARIKQEDDAEFVVRRTKTGYRVWRKS